MTPLLRLLWCWAGRDSFSRISTRAPARPRCRAALAPIAPAPTTTTSKAIERGLMTSHQPNVAYISREERPEVGITYIEGAVRGPTGTERVQFLIDSGAMYSLLPDAVWRRIGLTANREERFSLADGTSVSRPVSECHFALAQRAGHAPVILGEPDDPEPLLGVVTLENLGLVFDPFHRTLHPMRMLLI